MKLKTFSKNNKGITLLEVILGITILTIALVPILGYFNNSIGFVHSSELRSQALKIAGDTMEVLKEKAVDDFDNLNNIASNFSIDDIYGNYELLANYSLTVNIKGFDNDIEKIEVIVKWNNGAKSLQLVTLLAEG